MGQFLPAIASIAAKVGTAAKTGIMAAKTAAPYALQAIQAKGLLGGDQQNILRTPPVDLGGQRFGQEANVIRQPLPYEPVGLLGGNPPQGYSPTQITQNPAMQPQHQTRDAMINTVLGSLPSIANMLKSEQPPPAPYAPAGSISGRRGAFQFPQGLLY